MRIFAPKIIYNYNKILMKKTILKLALFTICIGWTNSTWALDQVDGWYQIGTAQDWADFCSLHNDGNNQNLNAVLTADVTVSGNTMVGINGSGKPYRGIFNGQGHKLTIKHYEQEKIYRSRDDTAHHGATNGNKRIGSGTRSHHIQ